MFSMTYARTSGVRLSVVRGQLSAALLLLMVACGGEQVAPPAAETAFEPAAPPPTEDAARTLVANSAEFSEYQFTNAAYTLPLQQSAMTAPARIIAGKLAKAGWIGVDGDGRVVLTQKAQNDKRFLVRPNGVVDIVPLAKKNFEEVVAVRVNPDGQPIVDFRWEWEPNEIGELFDPRYTGEQFATATLYRLGDQWAVLRIRPTTDQ